MHHSASPGGYGPEQKAGAELRLLILVIIGVMWVLVLLPPLMRSIREGRPSDSVGSFRRQLTVLERATPGQVRSANPYLGGPVVGYGMTAASARSSRPAASFGSQRRRQAERRRQVFVSLLGVTVVTTLLALLTGQRLLQAVAGLACLLLAGFTWMLLQRQAHASRRTRVAVARMPRIDDDVDAVYRR
jgi:hypothetical protein